MRQDIFDIFTSATHEWEYQKILSHIEFSISYIFFGFFFLWVLLAAPVLTFKSILRKKYNILKYARHIHVYKSLKNFNWILFGIFHTFVNFSVNVIFLHYFPNRLGNTHVYQINSRWTDLEHLVGHINKN